LTFCWAAMQRTAGAVARAAFAILVFVVMQASLVACAIS
jgi:hypothetical protein